MRKKCLIILLAVLVAFTLSVPVLAADGQSRGFFDTLADIGIFIRDLFVPDGDYFNDLIRNFLNARACLFTAITCYHKLRHFFTEEG